MDKEILEILKSLQDDTKEIRSALKEIDRKLDGVVEQTADLTEFRTSVISRLDELKEVEEVTKANCYEIAKLKIIK